MCNILKILNFVSIHKFQLISNFLPTKDKVRLSYFEIKDYPINAREIPISTKNV